MEQQEKEQDDKTKEESSVPVAPAKIGREIGGSGFEMRGLQSQNTGRKQWDVVQVEKEAGRRMQQRGKMLQLKMYAKCMQMKNVQLSWKN